MNFRHEAFSTTLAIASWFYSAFVLEELWNWFVLRLLNVEQCTYWVAFGILLMARFFHISPNERAMFKKFFPTTPAERIALAKEVEAHEQSGAIQEIVLNAMTLFSNTAALVLGWAIHEFLL